MNDILPGQTPTWQFIEQILRQLLAGYGYSEIRMPLVEKTELFKRSIGEVTDIVEKEMYTFDDRNGDSLTLRPEGTAGCVRAGIENGLLHNQTQRLWYMGPMFRHERPQKGRYRQFHQVGVEVFGLEGPDVDAELILMTRRSLGSAEARAAYRERLVAYCEAHYDALDEDSRRRLQSNPLRILDSKNPEMQELIADAPRLMEHLDEASRRHFAELCAALDAAGVSYHINTRLVRGLDYYGRTVFEWVTDRLGAQGTVCAGGRFDTLVDQIGGRGTPAIGFAVGLERLVALVDEAQVPQAAFAPHAYLVRVGEAVQAPALLLSERLRDALPGLRLQVHCGGGSFKSQLKRADKSGARLAIIVGEAEQEAGTAVIKDLRRDEEQETVAQSELSERLRRLVEGGE